VFQPRATFKAIAFCCAILSFSSTSGRAQDSVADAARKNRSKDAQLAPKKVWTNDDMSSASVSSTPSNEQVAPKSNAEILRQFKSLSKEELGAAVLRRAGAPNADFPGRKDWEQRLFEAKQSWIDQVDRMENHKESSKATQEEETRLAEGAQRIFDRISGEGILQARATTDPALKARLEYQRQLDFCMHVSGDAHDRCMAALEQLKWKMQKEGIW
jgi:uncharacterized protein YhaN